MDLLTALLWIIVSNLLIAVPIMLLSTRVALAERTQRQQLADANIQLRAQLDHAYTRLGYSPEGLP
jgi:hypothetical protein